MGAATAITIGAAVSCTDEACGEVSRVVVDPVASEVTHLVVAPKHGIEPGRLVPLDLVDATAPGEVRLRCTRAEFENLDQAEETQFLPASTGYESYAAESVLFWPYFYAPRDVPITVDATPLGEVTVRRGEPVHATDGDIGRVRGLVVDRENHHVTHVLLQEGHLWGRKEVAIPIGLVSRVGAEIQLKVSKQEVQDLPPIDADHPYQ